MPKTPIDYAKTIIYKLVHKDDLYDENIYTGHTTEMTKRKAEHKSSCNNPNSDKYNQKNYKYIRENGGWDEWCMIEIEKYPCKDKPEAIARERVIQTEMKAKLNTCIAGRTKKEWTNDNFEKIKKTKEKHYIDNKDKIIERSIQYYIHNKDKVIGRSNQRYIDNKDIINEKRKQKTTCDHCGSIVTKSDMARHKKTKKCINFKPS